MNNQKSAEGIVTRFNIGRRPERERKTGDFTFDDEEDTG